MNRKILFTIMLVLMAIFAISSVSAFDLGFLGLGDENETVTIDGIDFNIPAGFEENEDYSSENATDFEDDFTFTTNGKMYIKDDIGVYLLVGQLDDAGIIDAALNEIGGKKTKINGVDGYLLEFEDEDAPLYSFCHEKDDKIVVVMSNDKDVIGDFIIN